MQKIRRKTVYKLPLVLEMVYRNTSWKIKMEYNSRAKSGLRELIASERIVKFKAKNNLQTVFGS